MNNRYIRAKTCLSFVVFFVFLSNVLFAGQIVAWGSNSYGQCSVPDGDDFIAVAAAWHSLALKADGSIVSWGSGGGGSYPPPAGNDFVAISAANYFSLALKKDGSIVAWGSQCLDVPAGNDFLAIAAGGTQGLALRSDGSLVSWGSITNVPTGNNYVAIGSGSYHNIALRSDGVVVRWNGPTTEILGSNCSKIAAGEGYNIAIKTDGSFIKWPGGSIVSDGTFEEIDAGDYYWAGIKSDGTLFDSGGNTVPAGNDYSSIAVGVYHGLAIRGSIEIPGGIGQYGGGNGTVGEPFQISSVANWQELMATSVDWNKHFVLTADIDLAGITLSPVGNTGIYFSGVFDGDRHIIRNTVINEPSSDAVGLFGYLGIGGKLKNLGIEGANVQGHRYVGGLVGYNSGGLINFCYSAGIVIGDYSIGGLVGWNESSGVITASFSMCDVSCTGPYQVGGLVGVNAGIIDSCFARGMVSGPGYVGGLISENISSNNVFDSYATGTVSGEFLVGGLVGNGGPTVQDCFWDVQTSGTSIGDGGGSEIGYSGMTTAEMQTLSTFISAGWDFQVETTNGTNDYWVMPQGGGYPEIAFWSTVQPVSLSVLSLNGGESLTVGVEYLIEWSSTGNISDVLIEYSTDNGQNWIGVEPPNAGNTGSYNWLVPNANSIECLIRITDSLNPSVSDTCNNLFRISQTISLGELVVNGNAETGDMNGWISEGVLSVQSGAGLPGPYGGSYFFSGLAYSPYAYQEIDISGYSSDIDSGAIKCLFSAYLASPAMDPVSITLSFKTNSGGILETSTFGPPPLDNQWRHYSLDEHTLPVGTRTIRVQMDYWTAGGVVAEGCADEISLVLTRDAVTPPVADPNGPYTIYVDDPLVLDASNSLDEDGAIVSYMWDLDDDGNYETDAGSEAVFVVSYEYLQTLGLLVNDTRNISLQVTDNDQATHTAATTLTIEPKPALKVLVDIKPTSCPNPLNVKSSGVLPVAILGTSDFDVALIDPASIELNGIRAIRSSFEDVATPMQNVADCNCIEGGPDGIIDLTLKFKTQEIVESLGEVNDKDVLTLELIGVLLGERPIEGSDCVLIRGKHKPFNKGDINRDGMVDMLDFISVTENWLKSSKID